MWTKGVGEEADFGIDWSTDLDPGDTVANSTWTVEPGLVVGSGTKDPYITTDGLGTRIWLSGGTDGVEYEIVNDIITTGGRDFQKRTSLRVETETIPDLPSWSGCDWPVDPACLTDVWDATTDAVRARSISLASATLYRLTGYRVGGCPITVRPNRERACCGVLSAEVYQSPFMFPVNYGGVWSNVVCGYPTDERLVSLPLPIGQINEVKVDGAVIPPADYTISDGKYLAWVGAGDAPWPQTQDWLVPDTEVGTFSVTYLNSYPVDGYGAYAAGLMALEFAKACTEKGKCRLPSTVTNIVRQGVSYELAAGAFPNGRTTIREVDAYIDQWNPKGRRPGIVIDPGAPKVHVQR
jgi:hypothetical protein